MSSRLFVLTLVFVCVAANWLPAQTREEKVRGDRARVESAGIWLYNDFDKALDIAREKDKPVLVVLRCVPCEECVKLDDELVDNDPVIRSLLDQYVCVRIVGTNGLDLDVFQFDTDQSFAVFMLNADKTIYGRFGTRSHRTDWLGDVSLEGLARALQGGLELHANYPVNKASLLGKSGSPLEFSRPEKFPLLKDSYTDQLDYEGDVVKSCIHCHQIGDARREYYWNQSQPIPERLLFPYPHPKSIGMVMDPDYPARIRSIIDGSAAEKAGLRAGDDVVTLQSQPMLSMADVQWVLHQVAADGGELKMTVSRDGAADLLPLTMVLNDGWRRAGDLSWRVSSWQLGKNAAGGMRLRPLTKEERTDLGIDLPMALMVRHVGQYGEHAAAKRAGFLKGDVVVSYDGRQDLTDEGQLFHYVNSHRKPGDKVAIEVLRNGKRRTMSLSIQR